MKLTLTFADSADLTKVDKDDVYRTYFTLPSQVLELPDVHEKLLNILLAIDLVLASHLFVSCDELNWRNLPVHHPEASKKRPDFDFASGAKIRFHNRSARKKRDMYKTLQTLGGGFGNNMAGAYKVAEAILELLKTDGNVWQLHKVMPRFRDNRVVNMFNNRVKANIKAKEKQEREAAKQAKLEARSATDTKPKKGHIYFIQQGENGAIKIGYSTDPEKRLRTLRTASPYPLQMRLVIEGSKKLEKELHDKFADCQLDGEWFEATDVLLRFMEEQQC
jgi:hypothetical protein